MRLFLAIELEESARAAVVDLQRRLLSAVAPETSALRMVHPEQLHLTLVFLGEVSEDRARALMNALQPPLVGAPYTLALGGIGMFPPRGAPRVLWLGVVGGGPETTALRAAILTRVSPVGMSAGVDDSRGHHERAFTAHLTLGRWRDGRPCHRRTLVASGPSATVAVASTRVDAVTLFHSRVGSAGASHVVLARTRLEGA
jgi:2'-5' RNA ligase